MCKVYVKYKLQIYIFVIYKTIHYYIDFYLFCAFLLIHPMSIFKLITILLFGLFFTYFLTRQTECPLFKTNQNKYSICPKCNGKKKIICPDCQNKRDVICPTCNGKGAIFINRKSPRGFKHSKITHSKQRMSCPTCFGHKKIYHWNKKLPEFKIIDNSNQKTNTPTVSSDGLPYYYLKKANKKQVKKIKVRCTTCHRGYITCTKCNGLGKISTKNSCPLCKGKGTVPMYKALWYLLKNILKNEGK